MTIRLAARRGALAAALVLVPGAAWGQSSVALPAQDRPLRADGAVVFSVGGGSGTAALAQPAAVAFDRSENLYVLDRGSRAVVVYDRTGRALRRVGGPGQLSSPVALAVTADGAVVVLDVARGLVVLSPNGGVRGTHTVPGLDPYDTRGTLIAHPERGVVVSGRPAGADATPRQHPLRTSTALAWNRLDGAAPRELRIARAHVEAREHEVESASAAAGMRVTTRIRPVFSPEVRWAVLPDGRLAVAETETYRVSVAAAGGAPRVLTRPLRPRAVTDADRERYRARRQGSTGGEGHISGGSMTMTVGAGSVPFATTLPTIQRLVADPAGRLWIQRTGAVWGADGPIDVVRADGTYVGTLPAGPLPAAFSRGGLAAYIDGARVRVQRLPAALAAAPR
jgi:hypothetical protein